MKALLALAALAAATLPGCLSDDSTPPLLTAMQAREAADRAAAAWMADAELHSASAFEAGREAAAQMRRELAEEASGGNGTGNQTDDVQGDELEDEMLDAALEGSDSPGDGLARAWRFTYASNATDARYHVLVDVHGVAAEREAPYNETQDVEFLDSVPIANWTVDSDEAADLAAEANATFAQERGRPDAAAFTLLFRLAGEDPWWLLGTQNETDETSFVVVNAHNGSVVPFEAFLAQFLGFLLPQEAGSLGFTLSAVEPQDSGSFEVGLEGHSRLAVSLSLDQPVPLSSVSLTVTDPEGRAVSLQAMATPGLPGVEEFAVLEDVPAGTYTLDLELSSGVAQGVEVSWCTDGIPTPFFGEPACGHLD